MVKGGEVVGSEITCGGVKDPVTASWSVGVVVVGEKVVVGDGGARLRPEGGGCVGGGAGEREEV